MLTVGLLGPVELRRDGERVALPGGKTTELLVRLALEAGRTVRSERLIDDLWGDEGVGTAKNTLQSKVSQLRKALGDPDFVKGGASGYSLALDPSAVDAIEVCRLAELTSTLLAAGERGEALRSGSAALEMFRGEILVDAGEGEWIRPHRARLVEVHEQLVEDTMAARLEMGAAAELIGELEALVQLHPLRERIRGQLMLALYRAGRQADALRAYQAARTVLGDELGLEPGRELQRLEAAILAQDPDLDPPERPSADHDVDADGRVGNLPAAVSSFIGRTRELSELSSLVESRRLITLVGPGGAGKTRLALEVAEHVRSEFADGVWFVEFAPLKSGSDVAAAVATALGVDDSDRLRTYVTQRRMLLLFDNCEHVLDDAAAIATTLLGAGPGVTILATSRERLGASGELLYPVQSLEENEAAELFVERASAGGLPSDALEQLDAIAAICDRLDHMPLALELAAARTRSLSLDEIVARIDDRFALLTGGNRTAAVRHQTLRGVVDWSYELLFSAEQRVLRYVSIFDGGFDLQAAEAVCASDQTPTSDIVDLLGNLIDKSLVTVSHRNGQTRYTMLQTLADYGRHQLHAVGEDVDARDRHLRWMVELATSAESGLRTSAQLTWVERTRYERDNIRAALAWAVEQGRAADAVAIVAGFGYAWYISGSDQRGARFDHAGPVRRRRGSRRRAGDRARLGRMDDADDPWRHTRRGRPPRAGARDRSLGVHSQLLCRRRLRVDIASISWPRRRRLSAWSTRPTLGSTSSQIDGLARGSIGCVPVWSTRRETPPRLPSCCAGALPRPRPKVTNARRRSQPSDWENSLNCAATTRRPRRRRCRPTTR